MPPLQLFIPQLVWLSRHDLLLWRASTRSDIKSIWLGSYLPSSSISLTLSLQLDASTVAAATCSVRQLDVRTKCILVAATVCAVLPLEVHHLLAAVVGALGYMIHQILEPSVQRVPKSGKTFKSISSEPRVAPWRSHQKLAAKDREKKEPRHQHAIESFPFQVKLFSWFPMVRWCRTRVSKQNGKSQIASPQACSGWN